MIHWTLPLVLRWAPAVAVCAHITEEFALPGGFSAWYRRYRPETAASFSKSFAVTVNAVLLAVTLLLAFLPEGPRSVAFWLTVVALLFANACFHLVAAVRMREYSPGLVTAMLLYVPLAIVGFTHFVRSGQASWGTASSAAVLGGAYNVFTAWNHRRRAARTSAR